MKPSFLTLLLMFSVIGFCSPGRADGYRYDWFGGAVGYGGYIILDSPASSGGSASNIIAARIDTPTGSVDFNPATVYASKPLFTWDATQITSMFFAWGFSEGPPSAAIAANYDYNFNGTLHTYLYNFPSNPETNISTDESGLWIATDAQIIPQFKTHPVSQDVISGAPVTFTTRAIAKPAPTYQWRKNGTDIAGATGTTYSISSTSPDDAGSYTVVASNSVGSTTSSPATLIVALAPPVIISHPSNQAVVPGQNATFNVSASGVSDSGYQWQRRSAGSDTWNDLSNTVNYSGVTTNVLTISGTTLGMNGDQFRCIAASLYGSAMSNVATLSVATFVSDVTSVSAGYNHAMFVRSNGTLWGTGGNYQGQLGDGTLTERHTPVQIAGGVKSVSAGYLLTLFVKLDGTLWATGSNESGQLGDGTTTQRQVPVQIAADVASVSAYGQHSMFIKKDGTLWAMGYNDRGQLGDGTVAQRHTPVQVATGVASVSVGGSHSMFIKNDGTLWGMGSNDSGQLGDGTLTERRLPVQVATGVASVSSGSNHTMFVKTDGTLWATGSNYGGILGDGTTVAKKSPVQVATGVASVSAGDSHTLFVKTDGSMWAMGINEYGKLGDGTTTTRNSPVQVAGQAVSVAVSYDYTLFVLSNQTLWTMGRNFGWTDDGVGLVQQLPVQVSPVAVGYPLIVTQPASQSVNSGSTVTLTAMANGTPAPTYQWRKNGADIIGATSQTLILGIVQLVDAGTYSVVVTNSAGSVSSNDAILTVMAVPVIVSQPYDAFPLLGGDIFFSVAASGLPAATFQWQRSAPGSGTWSNLSNGAAYSGATNSTLIVTGVTRAMSGDRFRCVVTNAAGSVTSNAAALTVMPPPADFNGDDQSDLFFTNTTTGERSVRLMNGTTLGSELSLGSVGAEWSAVTGDFNADGKTDLLWQNTTNGDCYIWLMNGTSLSSSVYLGNIGVQWSVAGTGDFNGDGKSDILWSNTTTGDRYVWLMNGTALGSSVFLGNLGPRWLIAGTGDFNADGQTDLVWQNMVTGERRVWLMNGTVKSSQVSLGLVSTSLRIAGVGDFNGDGKPDLVWQNTSSGERLIWLMNGTGATSSVSLGLIDTQWIIGQRVVPAPSVQVASDFNADGQSDLLWSNTTNGDRYVWLMNGTAVSSSVFLGAVAPTWTVVTGDFNDDGQSDLLWSNTTNGDRYVWLMNGTAVSSSVFLGNIAAVWTVVTGDFNADGQSDLLWTNTTTGDRYVWLMNGTAVSSSVFLGAVAPTWTVVTGDFNSDGKSDLLWSNTTNGDRYIWLMNGTSISSSVFLSTVAPVWSVTTGDYNADGQSDLLWSNTSTGDRYVWLMNGTSVGSSVFLSTVAPAWSVGN